MNFDDVTIARSNEDQIVRRLEDLAPGDSDVGGKAQRLSKLTQAGFSVPSGFVIPAGFYRNLHHVNVDFDSHDPQLNERFAPILAAYDREFKGQTVLVRSSALAEDSTGAAFAGVFESVLDVTRDSLVEAILTVYRSTSAKQVQSYVARKQGAGSIDMAVVVQEQVEPRWSGAIFTADPVSGKPQYIIEYVSGRSEQLLLGRVSPGRFVLDRNLTIISHQEFSGSEDSFDATAVAAQAQRVEELFGAPQDIEWVVDTRGVVSLVQSRDITTVSAGPTLEKVDAPAATPVAIGLPISRGVVSGTVRVLPSNLSGGDAEKLITPGTIVVAQLLSSDHIDALSQATGIITSEASLLSHPAVTARELGIPCVGDVPEAVTRFTPGETVTIDGNSGAIYHGTVETNSAIVVTKPVRMLYYNPDRVRELNTDDGVALYEQVDEMVQVYTADVADAVTNQRAQKAVSEHLGIALDAVSIDKHGLWEGPSGPSVVYSQYRTLAGLRSFGDTAQFLDSANQLLDQLDGPGLAELIHNIDDRARRTFAQALTAWNEYKTTTEREHADATGVYLEEARRLAGDVVETILQVLGQTQLEKAVTALAHNPSLGLSDLYRLAHSGPDTDQIANELPADQKKTLLACLSVARVLEEAKDQRLDILTMDDTTFFDILEGMDEAGFEDIIEQYGW